MIKTSSNQNPRPRIHRNAFAFLSHSKNINFFPSPNPSAPTAGPCRAKLQDKGDLECPSQEVSTDLLQQLWARYPRINLHNFCRRNLFGDLSLLKFGFTQLKASLKPEKPLSSGKHDFGEEMRLRDATGETPMNCLGKNRLSQGSTFLQHPLQPPRISHHGIQAGGVLQTGFFPPVLLLSGSLQHTVKPCITEEGKGFTTVFKKQAQAAEDASFSTHSFGQHVGFQAALLGSKIRAWHNPWGQQHRPHLQLTEPPSCPNPSSCPCLGHGTLRNSLSAKQQRQLLQKQNKTEYKEEQAACLPCKLLLQQDPRLATSSPYRQRPRPPSQLPFPRIMDFLSQEHREDKDTAGLGEQQTRAEQMARAGRCKAT